MAVSDRGDSLAEAGKLRAELADIEGRLREAEAAYQERERLKRILDSPEDFPDVDLDEIKQKFAEADEPGRRASLTRLRLRQRRRDLERDLFDYRFDPDTYEEDEEEYDAGDLWDDDDSECDEGEEDVRFEFEEAKSELRRTRVFLRRDEERLAGTRETIARYKALLSDRTQVERLAQSPNEWPSLGLDVDEDADDSAYARTLAAVQAALAGERAVEDHVKKSIKRYKREILKREAKINRLLQEIGDRRKPRQLPNALAASLERDARDRGWVSRAHRLWDRLAPVRISELVRREDAMAIVRATRHRSYRVRADAEREIAHWPANVASAVLSLDHPSAAVRVQAAEQLAHAPLDHFAVRAGLRLGAGDRDYHVAYAAAKALIKTGDAAALWPLVESWEESEVEESAARAAARLDAAAVDQLLEGRTATPEGEAGLIAVLQAMAPRVATRLAERSADSHLGVRVRAVKALGSSRDPSHADVVLGRLRDRSEEVRAAALHSLQRLGVGSPQAIPLLDDRSEFVRRAAVELIRAARIEGGYEALLTRLKREKEEITRGVIVSAIAETDGEAAIPLLAATLAEGRGAEHYRYPTFAANEAARALRRLGRAGIEVLLEKAHDPDPVVRDAVLDEIGSLPRDHRVAQVLADALRDERFHITANDAFVGSGRNWYSLWHAKPVQATQDVLLPMLDDPDAVIRARACRALMSQEVPRVAERVRRLFAEDPDPEVRGQALRTLAAMDAPGLRDLARPLLEDGDPVLREHASWALEHADLVSTVHRQHGRDPWATA